MRQGRKGSAWKSISSTVGRLSSLFKCCRAILRATSPAGQMSCLPRQAIIYISAVQRPMPLTLPMTWESCTGNGAVPAAFKVDKFRRVLPTDNLNEVLASNSDTLMTLFVDSLYKLSSEWVAGFIRYAADNVEETETKK